MLRDVGATISDCIETVGNNLLFRHYGHASLRTPYGHLPIGRKTFLALILRKIDGDGFLYPAEHSAS